MRRLLSATVATSVLLMLLAVSAPSGAVASTQSTDPTQAQPQPETGFVPELSSTTSSTYRHADGSFTMEVFTEPVNFTDDEGNLKTIDASLVDSPGAVYDVQTAANSVVVRIPEDASIDPVRIVDDAGWVSMRLHGMTDEPATIDGSTATFSEVANADSVSYEATATGVKESVTVAAPPSDALSFIYDIDAAPGLRPALQPNGTIWFLDDGGTVQFSVPPPFMTDSAPDSPAYSDDVPVSLDPVGDHWKLTMTPDLTWLADPARVYPVIVDPSVVNLDTNYDCWVSQGDPNNGMCGGGADHFRVGVAANDGLKRRALLNFNVSSIPSTATITSATAKVYLDSSMSTNHQSADYGLHIPSKAWNNTATWNSSGPNGSWTGGSPGGTTYSLNTLNGSSDGYKQFTGLRALVQGWVDGSIARRGMVLKQEAESTINVLCFYSSAGPSSKRPYMVINFELPAVLGSIDVTPGGPGYSLSATPGLSVSAVDPDGGPVSIQFQLRQGSSSVWTSDPQVITSSGLPSPADMVVPQGVLEPGMTYEAVATATDAAGGTSSVTNVFQVDSAAAVQVSGACSSPCTELATPVQVWNGTLPAHSTQEVAVDTLGIDFDVVGTIRTTLSAGPAPNNPELVLYDSDLTQPIAPTLVANSAASSTALTEIWPSDANKVTLANRGSVPVDARLTVVGWTPWQNEETDALDAAELDVTEPPEGTTLAVPTLVLPSEAVGEAVYDEETCEPAYVSAGETFMDCATDAPLPLGAVYESADIGPGYSDATAYFAPANANTIVRPNNSDTAEYLTPTEFSASQQEDCGELPVVKITSRSTSCSYIVVRLRRYRVDTATGQKTLVSTAKLRMTFHAAVGLKTVNSKVHVDHYFKLEMLWAHGMLKNGVEVRSTPHCHTCTVASGSATVSKNYPIVASDWIDQTIDYIPLGTTSYIDAYQRLSFPLNILRDRKVSDGTIRCDNISYLPSQGCVFTAYRPTLKVVTGDYPEAASHIASAISRNQIYHWGAEAYGHPLSRHYWQPDQVNKNRKAAQKLCRERGLSSCDEYPFASTNQGCHFIPASCDVAGIDLGQNKAQGRALGRFYGRERVANGDYFWVKVVP